MSTSGLQRAVGDNDPAATEELRRRVGIPSARAGLPPDPPESDGRTMAAARNVGPSTPG